ncbi:MAG TPA: TolC family protein [Acidisarcina sp.]|nr:TolC family protein [Acidisarcina sp.]
MNVEKGKTHEAHASHQVPTAARVQSKLQTTAMVACLLLSTVSPYGMAQQTPPVTPPAGMKDLPPTPAPNYTQPMFMRSTPRDFTRPQGYYPNPLAPYKAISMEPSRFTNTARIHDLIRDGKIYLSLSDAITLALENNYDIAIARFNLDIADTDILRSKAGAQLRGVNTGIVSGTQGTAGQTLISGGGPGGTSVGSSGAGAGAGGLVTNTSSAGPNPESLDPTLTGTIQYENAKQPTSNPFSGAPVLSTGTTQYDFAYNQGFLTGTALTVGFNNSRQTTNSQFSSYSPQYNTNFKAEVTQHLLQGFGWGVNSRFIVQAKNNRRITDASFRQQILYTVNQIENIYWGLVSSYEDVQAKERALTQSKQLTADNRKQVEIGTLAPLEVINSDSQVASDQQALISSQTALEYQQMVMKQAMLRNLSDPELSKAPVIPTDRVSLIESPEEKMSVDDLVKQAYTNRPEVEQDILQLKNSELSMKAIKNELLPVVDAYGFYGASAIGGSQNPNCMNFVTGKPCVANQFPTVSYGTAFSRLFNSSAPDKGVGVNISIPIHNRIAQSDQARSVLEYRQNELRLEQIYIQIRTQVLNGVFALTNDRAQVQAALAAREFAYQSLDSEQKKYHLGASTTANVLQQQRNLAAGENNLIVAKALYAKDRAALSQTLANTLEHYGISLGDAVSGKISQVPVVPGVEAPKDTKEPSMPLQPAQQ